MFKKVYWHWFLLRINILLFICTKAAFSQQIPTQKISYQDFDLKKGIDQVMTATYRADSTITEPLSFTVLQFNQQGELVNDYTRILGTFGSETVLQYLYKDGKIDSLNKKASAKNFSTKSKFHYNATGFLDSITTKGFYVDYTDRFIIDKNNRIKMMERVYKKGYPGYKEHYQYDSNSKLKYSKIQKNGEPNLLTFYNGTDELFSFEEGRDTLTVKITKKEVFKVYIGKMTIARAAEMRQQYINNPEEFDRRTVKPLLKQAHFVYAVPANMVADSGEWVRRFVVDKSYRQKNNQLYLFRKYIYHDKHEVGSFDFSELFKMQVEKRGLHKMIWD